MTGRLLQCILDGDEVVPAAVDHTPGVRSDGEVKPRVLLLEVVEEDVGPAGDEVEDVGRHDRGQGVEHLELRGENEARCGCGRGGRGAVSVGGAHLEPAALQDTPEALLVDAQGERAGRTRLLHIVLDDVAEILHGVHDDRGHHQEDLQREKRISGYLCQAKALVWDKEQ